MIHASCCRYKYSIAISTNKYTIYIIERARMIWKIV